MPCNPVLLGALADGELRGLSAWRMRRHLAHCTSCQQELAELEALSVELKSCSPLPLPYRKPIHRPLGIVRPAATTAATLALASVSAFFVARAPVSNPDSPRFVQAIPPSPRPESPRLPLPSVGQAESAPSRLPVASAERSRKTPRKRTVRRKTYHRPLLVTRSVPRQPKVEERAQETEQVIIVASEIILPKPVTVVLNDQDNDGGTIHIESTIPAAYVVAMQKEIN